MMNIPIAYGGIHGSEHNCCAADDCLWNGMFMAWTRVMKIHVTIQGQNIIFYACGEYCIAKYVAGYYNVKGGN